MPRKAPQRSVVALPPSRVVQSITARCRRTSVPSSTQTDEQFDDCLKTLKDVYQGISDMEHDQKDRQRILTAKKLRTLITETTRRITRWGLQPMAGFSRPYQSRIHNSVQAYSDIVNMYGFEALKFFWCSVPQPWARQYEGDSFIMWWSRQPKAASFIVDLFQQHPVLNGALLIEKLFVHLLMPYQLTSRTSGTPCR